MKQVKEEFKVLVIELLAIPSEEREAEIIERLDIISPDPGYTDYIYHSDEFNNVDGSFDIEGYADKVFSYKPIQL